MDSLAKLEEHLLEQGYILWAPAPISPEATNRSIQAENAEWDPRGTLRLFLAVEGDSRLALDTSDGLIRMSEGLMRRPSEIIVSDSVYEALCREIQDETAPIRRLSSRPIVRNFVYVDVSDFSKMATGLQLLVISALVRLARAIQPRHDTLEAQLCIGDGYIFVFSEPVAATIFAAHMAQKIESDRAQGHIPEFHFRIGVHMGPVRCFWDPGRNGWNYVGDGINGGQRVLSAIGKETDDVVFVSGEIREELFKIPRLDPRREAVLPKMENRGRRMDKHGRAWRVYQLSHTAVGMTEDGEITDTTEIVA